LNQPRTTLSPQLFNRTITAHQNTAILRTALELDLFAAFAGEPRNAAEIAEHCDASERGARILSNALVSLGFLTKDVDRYAATEETARFLDSTSPAYIGTAAEFHLSPTRLEGFAQMTEAVRKGGTPIAEGGVISPEEPTWPEFAHCMAPMAAIHAPRLVALVGVDETRPVKVLDIAASHGLYGITFAEQHPNVEVVALDWPNVVEVASKNAAAHGVADRHRTLPGSAFEVEFGDGYDIVLMTAFLHMFDPASCEAIFSKAHAALNEGGRAVTMDFMTDEGKTSPPVGAIFAAIMLATSPGGDAYTFAEFESMAANAGFARSERFTMEPSPQRIVISYK